MALASILLVLAACGGGGSSTRPQTTPQATAQPLDIEPRENVWRRKLLATGGPLAPQGSARQAPVVYLDANEAYWKSNPSHWNRRALDGRWHIGGDVSPVTDHALPTIRHHDATAVSYGEIRDGVGRDKVVRYLEQMATGHWAEYGSGLFTLDTPPVVRLAEGTDQTFRDYVVRAVRIINSALPDGWKMQISEETFPAHQTDLYLPEPRPGRGEIFVVFARDPRACSACYLSFPEWEWDSINQEWNYPQNSGGLVVINPSEWRPSAEGRSRSDWEQIILAVLVHEMLHGFGGAHHEMGKSNQGPEAVFGTPGHVLYGLDREALLAAYTRLKPGTLPERIAEELGPWSDTSIHVKGVLEIPHGEVAFGAAHRNGFVSPWANGPIPSADLADNAALSGSASWSGRLLGLTPSAEAVAGAADLTVYLAALNGELDFTELESWSPNAAPGAVGTGTRWQSGNLHYDIAVRGNAFVQTGGDAGTVTGVFFGRSHEGMGGVLERPDLSAGFGGKRVEPVEPAAVLSESGSFVQYYGPSWDEWIGPYSRWIPPPDFRSSAGWRAAIGEWAVAATEAWLTHKRTREAYRFFDAWGFEVAIGDKMLFSAVIDGTMYDCYSTLAPWVAVAECAPPPGVGITIEGTPTGYNPTVGSAVWSGNARGVDSRGYPIEEASVRLEADLDAATIDARLSHFERHIFSWRGLALTNGTFSQGEAFNHYRDGGTAETAPREWSIDGAFYGNDHQVAAGMWTEPSGAFGVFGALREQSEPVAKGAIAKVVSVADGHTNIGRIEIPSSGSGHSMVVQTAPFRYAHAVPYRNDATALEFLTSHTSAALPPHPLVDWQGRSVTTSEIAGVHGLLDGWQVFQGSKDYVNGGGTLEVTLATDADDSDTLGAPWVGYGETDRTIVLADIPDLLPGHDWQGVRIPDDGLDGTLDGISGTFTCDSGSPCWLELVQPKGYYPYPVGGQGGFVLQPLARPASELPEIVDLLPVS